jgi:hypothetical protein
MSDKKRRLDKLGAGRPDPALVRLTDAELLLEAERAAFGVAQAELDRELERRDPFVGDVQDLADDALVAEYEAVVVALVAQLQAMSDAQFRAARRRAPVALARVYEAAAERRWPKPTPVVAVVEPPAIVAAPPVIEPHPVALEPATLEPPPRPAPGSHVSVPVEDCPCFQCAAHRRAAREEDETRRLVAASEHEPMVEGSVRFAATATDELRERLTGGPGR